MNCILKNIQNVENIDKLNNGKPLIDNLVISGMIKNQKIVAKLTPSSCENKNGLETERKLYMYIANHMIQETPHMLEGLYVGKCGLIGFLKMKNIPSTTKSIFLSIFKNKYDQYLFDDTCVAKNKEYINYIITPKITGVFLYDFLTMEQKIIKKQNLEVVFAMQMAQALCVFTKHGFIHNDLHLGNIFVVKHLQPITFKYHFPFKFEITTQYQCIIYDYDFASCSNIKNTSNDSIHLNFFKYNWDWYLFLTHFIYVLQETNKKSSLSTFFPNIFDIPRESEEVGKNVVFGYALKCVEMEEKHCTVIEYDDETLQKLPSPLSFLEFCVQDKKRKKRILTRNIL